MKRFITAIIGAGLMLSAPQALANQLSALEIRKTIAGKRVYLTTKWGVEFPLTYKTNGKVTGDGTATGLGSYFAPKETGKWWVIGNQMCQKFPTWYNGRTFCFKLEQTNEDGLIWKRNDGATGTARIS